MTDWVELLEAAYAPSRDDARWADDIVAAAAPLLGPGPVGLAAIRHSADLASCSTDLICGAQAAASRTLLEEIWRDNLPRALRTFFYPADVACSWRSLAATLPDGPTQEWFERAFSRYARGDFLGLVMHPEPGYAAVLYAASEKEVRLSGRQKRSCTQLALHVEAGLRLRLRPETLLGVLSSDGKLLHREREMDVPLLRTLQRQARLAERARDRSVRRHPESLDLWQALAGGCASLLPRHEGTKRHYLVVENSPARQPMRALSEGELDVISYASHGLPQKMIGYGLGLPAPTVSAHLASAASKIGLATRMELVRIAAMLARDPRARFEETALTTAERDVLELVAHGLSNREIARMRGRSIRTIANQVASLLAKTKAPSRRTLVAAKAPRA